MPVCETTKAAVERFLDGDGTRAVLAEAERHAAGCPACAKEIAGALRLAEGLAAAVAVTVPAGEPERTIAAVAAAEAEQARPGRSPRRAWGLAIAALLVLAVVPMPLYWASMSRSGGDIPDGTIHHELATSREELVVIARRPEDRPEDKLDEYDRLSAHEKMMAGPPGNLEELRRGMMQANAEQKRRLATAPAPAPMPPPALAPAVVRRLEPSIVHVFAESYVQPKGTTPRLVLARARGTGFAVAPDQIVVAKHVLQPWKYDKHAIATANKIKEEHGLDVEDYVEVHMSAGAGKAFERKFDSAGGTLKVLRILPDSLVSAPETVEIEWNQAKIPVPGIRVHVPDLNDLALLQVPAGGLTPVEIGAAPAVTARPVLFLGTEVEKKLVTLSRAGGDVRTVGPTFTVQATVPSTFAGAPVLSYDDAKVRGVVVGTDGGIIRCLPADAIRALMGGGKGGPGGLGSLLAGGPGGVPVGLADIGTGTLVGRDADGRLLAAFPLEHTEVRAGIAGLVASTLIEQRFHNPYDRKIEAIYCFPLPETAAVNEFLMEIGERRIRGVIRERAEARRVYEAARARGQVATLLEQERPNVFTQSVANLEPGKRLSVKIRYFHALPCERATFTYVFPMVVGHRYGGDAAVTPPRVPEGMRSGHDVALAVEIDAGVPIEDISCATHEVGIERAGPGRALVRLSPRDAIPDKDFVLTYRIGVASETQIGLVAHADEDGKFFSLLAAPPLAPEAAAVVPRELFFILDSSGSMNGPPIQQSKRVIRHALERLRANDVFNVATFAGAAHLMSEQFLAPTPGNVGHALRWLDGYGGAGGTEAEKGIRLALEHPGDPRRLRVVVFLTDGGVSFEGDIFRRIEQSRGRARVFSFGAGSSVNRHLIEGLARHGCGVAAYVNYNEPEDSLARKVEAFYARLDAPVLVDATIDWGGLDVVVEDVFPRRIPDLFVGRPLVVQGRYRKGGRGVVTIRGRAEGGEIVSRAIEVVLPEREPGNAALIPIWARTKIEDLSAAAATVRAGGEEAAGIAREVRALALEFSLVSPYTSFVAVDEGSDTAPGAPTQVNVPVEVPAGVNPRNFGRD